MTQLPEVEVLRKELEKEVVGKRIKDVTVKNPGVVARHRNRPEFVRLLQGRKIEAVTRRATVLLFELDGDLVLVAKLGSQGTLSRETATAAPGKNTVVVATFTTGGALHVTDPGRDGELFVVERAQLDDLPELQRQGIDPLADTFTWPAFSQQLKARDVDLKTVLRNDSVIVGLGDLYSDEILWAAGLSGGRYPASLSSQEVRRLYRAVLEVLYEAVKQGGASDQGPGDPLDPFADAEYGGEFLKVYGKEGHPCARCRQPVRHGMIGDHDAYFCAQCQT